MIRIPSLLDLIGTAPLARVPFPSRGTLAACLEYLNPGGSIKDRAAAYMIAQAEQQGLLQPGGTLIEASSGNQGIATALIGAIKGYRVIITVSEKVSAEKRATLAAYGATVITCKPTERLDDPEGYHARAKRIHEQTPNSFMLNQYFNDDNRMSHYVGLGPHIWAQTQGRVTHFVAAAGSGGTVSGAGAFLKTQNPAIKVYAVDAATSYRTTQGKPKPYALEGMGVDYETPLLRDDVIDTYMPVTDEQAIEMLKTLAHTHGFLVGPASGAVAHAAAQLAPTLGPDDLLVMVFGDSGRAYLSKQFWAVTDVHTSVTEKSAQTEILTGAGVHQG